MSVSIQSNIASMKAHRSLGKTQQGLNSNLQRLSSGFRINGAFDDAAGLGAVLLPLISSRRSDGKSYDHHYFQQKLTSIFSNSSDGF